MRIRQRDLYIVLSINWYNIYIYIFRIKLDKAITNSIYILFNNKLIGKERKH